MDKMKLIYGVMIFITVFCVTNYFMHTDSQTEQRKINKEIFDVLTGLSRNQNTIADILKKLMKNQEVRR